MMKARIIKFLAKGNIASTLSLLTESEQSNCCKCAFTNWVKRLICLIAITLLFMPICSFAYENDGPGHNPNVQINAKTILRSSGTSFVEPPEASDILFVAKEGGNLGEEVWGPNGVISIPLSIDRYFGDKEKLILSGAISKTAKLTMYVYDVDNKSSYTPAEYDVVKFNDNSIDAAGKEMVLYGEDGAWTKVEFNIPIENVNLPTSPGVAAKNTITIYVDVKSTFANWVTAVNWASLEIQAAPPVIIAHGIRSGEDSMATLRRSIEEFGLPVHVFSFANNGNDGIAAGAEELSREVENAKTNFNVESVNIVAHSMGGLKARHYTESIPKDSVLHVLQIATPNAGSPLADWCVAKLNNIREKWPDWVEDFVDSDWFDEHLGIRASDPAAEELTTTFMESYNNLHRLNPYIRFGVIAGDVNRNTIGWTQFQAKHCYDIVEEHAGPNDTIVPVSSARALQMQTMATAPGDVKVVEHSALVNEGARISLSFLRSELLAHKESQSTIRPSTEVKAKSKAKNSVLKASLNATSVLDVATPKPGFGLKVADAKIGETTILKFHIINGNETSAEVKVLNCAKLRVALKSPTGVIYSDSANGVEFKLGESRFDFLLRNPEVGEWTMDITPIASRDKTKNSCLCIFSLSERDVEVNIDAKLKDESVVVGEPFVLTVKPTLSAEPITSTVEAIISSPSKVTSTIVLHDDGRMPDRIGNDGIYTANIPTTELGAHQITINVNNAKFSRTCLLLGIAHANSGEISNVSPSVIDNNSNGYYDKLVIGFDIKSELISRYRVLATLANSKGMPILEAWSDNIPCSIGNNTIFVDFEGEHIYQQGDCGAYVVSSAKLIEVSDSYEAVVDIKTNVLTISDWNYKQFEHSLVGMEAGGDETAIDDDEDGIYEQLDITIPLYADDIAAGSYEWSASLMDGEGVLLGTSTGDVVFSPGNGGAPIFMSFDADGIRSSSMNGPYYVKNLIIWNSERTFTIGGEYETQAYALVQWGGTPRTQSVTFDSNGGNGTMDEQVFTSGETRQLIPNAFVRIGYIFEGWATYPEGDVVYVDESSVRVISDMTLYAKWTPQIFIVSFDANGGDGTMASQTFSYGEYQNLYANVFIREGYTFVGWSDNAESDAIYSDGQGIEITSGMTLYAVWEAEVTPVDDLPYGYNVSEVEGCKWIWRYYGDGVELTGYYVSWQDSYGMWHGEYHCGVYPDPNGAIEIPSEIEGMSVVRLGEYLFYGCENLKSVIIPDTMTSIGWGAFEGSGIRSVAIPEGVEKIGGGAFYDCPSLEEVAIPSSVDYIGKGAFAFCPNLATIRVAAGNGRYGVRGGILYDDSCGTALAAESDITLADVEEGTLEIASYAFVNSEALTAVNIPSSVRSIGYYAFPEDVDAIYDTTTVPGVRTIDGWAIEPDWTTTYESLNLGNVRGIAECAFEYLEVTTLAIPQTCEWIGEEAFYRCEELESVTIPAGVKAIGDWAFENCTSLREVKFEGSLLDIDMNLNEVFAGTPWLASYSPEAPANDMFADAEELTGTSGSVRASNFGATVEPGEPLADMWDSTASVWWRWEAPANGTVVVDTFGSAFDTVLGVYVGDSVDALDTIADCDDADDVDDNTSAVEFEAVKGTTYFIAVAGYDSDFGRILLNWTYDPPLRLAKIPVTIDPLFAGDIDINALEFIVGAAYGEALEEMTREIEGAIQRHGVAFAGWENGDGSEITPSTIVKEGDSLTAWWEKFNPLADGKDAVDAVSAQIYDGYVLDADGNVAGTILVKVGKPNAKTGLASVGATLQMLGEGKLMFKASGGGKAQVAESGPTQGIVLSCVKTSSEIVLDYISKDGIYGAFGNYEIVGVRNTSKKEPAEYAQWMRTVNVSFRTTAASGGGAAFAAGYSSASVSIGAKGKVKITGTMADGTKVKASAQLLLSENHDVACVNAFVPMYSGKKGGFGFVLWLNKDGSARVESVGGWKALGKSGQFDAKLECAGIQTLVAPSGSLAFSAEGLPSAIGGAMVVAEYLPKSVTVKADGGRFIAGKPNKVKIDKTSGNLTSIGETDNNCSLKLTYAAKNGTFKGSFVVWTQSGAKLKKNKATVNGVMIGNKGYGSAIIKNTGSFPVILQ